jgi:hypothetical protein
LTFKARKVDDIGAVSYVLTVPNLEIQISLNYLFIDYLTNQRHAKYTFRSKIKEALQKKDFTAFVEVLRSIFASIPYHNYAKNIISSYEGYYISVIYVYLKALGYEVIPEDATNKGRIDLTIKLSDKVIIIEFKVDSKESALKQIMERKYYEKYEGDGKAIYLVGIKFDSKERNIVEWECVKRDA